MAMTDEFARGRVSMHIDARLPKGSVILCIGHGEEHSFLIHRLGLSVECPKCGQIALSVDLVADFYKRPTHSVLREASALGVEAA